MDVPPPFSTVIGHARAKAQVQRAHAAGRLTGSLLLVGPAGIGRTRFAAEVARLFVDPAGGAGPAGGRVLRGTHADYQQIVPAADRATISIEQVRETLEEMSKAPVEGHGRAFVFEPADSLGEAAQNALLKGLEEPSPRTLVILIAHTVDELLTTIASRCQVIELKPLSREEVLEVLRAQGVSAAE
ncbi:MAG: AAA family ATPase, partial [Planctomycetes bacterium]|nr:AAA family ATPase [Planctomycetota bacterium]